MAMLLSGSGARSNVGSIERMFDVYRTGRPSASTFESVFENFML